MKKINKSVLKEGYYHELLLWYDSLPEKLPTVAFVTEILPNTMTNKEILKKYKIVPYTSYEQAAGVCATVIPELTNNYKSRIVYFQENEVLYCFRAWRVGDGQLRVSVGRVDLSDDFGAGRGVCFSNSISGTSNSFLDFSDSMELETMIELTKTQTKYLEAFEWLVGSRGSRAEGRSTLLAVVFIQKAVNNPGQKVYVFDHNPGYFIYKRVLDQIRILLPDDLRDHFKFYPIELAIKYS